MVAVLFVHVADAAVAGDVYLKNNEMWTKNTTVVAW